MKFADALRDRDACLPRLAELLGSYQVAVETFPANPPAEGSGRPGGRDASRPSPGEEPVRVRNYRPAGLPEIVIPEEYDAALDEVRRLRQSVPPGGASETRKEAERARARLSEHPLGEALLPEELLPVLAHLPTPARRVVLWNRFERQERRDPRFGSAVVVSRDGVITLSQRKRGLLDYAESSELRKTLFSQWSHLLRWGSPPWWDWFERAARLEPVPVLLQATQMAGVPIGDLADNWASHLANLSSLNESDGQLTLEQVPLRTTVLAKALAAALDALPENQRGKYHNEHADNAGRLLRLRPRRAGDVAGVRPKCGKPRPRGGGSPPAGDGVGVPAAGISGA